MISDAIIEKALAAAYAGHLKPRRGSSRYKADRLTVKTMLLAVEGDLRLAVLQEAIERAKSRKAA